MRRFVVSDWHIGENRWEIMGRPGFSDPLDMVDHLVKCHNSVVEPNDIVYVVGDVMYSGAGCDPNGEPWSFHIGRFNGKKILVRGNHDRPWDDKYFLGDSKYHGRFSEVIPDGSGIELRVGDIDCYITHYPSCARQDLFNLVGHVHGAWRVQLNMLNVGVDVHHYYPLDLDKHVPLYYRAICDFYDQDIFAAHSPVNSSYAESRGKKSSYFSKV